MSRMCIALLAMAHLGSDAMDHNRLSSLRCEIDAQSRFTIRIVGGRRVGGGITGSFRRAHGGFSSGVPLVPGDLVAPTDDDSLVAGGRADGSVGADARASKRWWLRRLTMHSGRQASP